MIPVSNMDVGVCVFVCLSVLLAGGQQCLGHKAVIYMHGIFSAAHEGNQILSWIQQAHPGTATLTVDMYNNLDSLANMTEQVENVKVTMADFMAKHPGGVHLIGYSQGGMVSRGVLETLNHTVDTFISVSSPQGGQFGDTNYMKFLFPHLLRDDLYKVLYTDDGQKISVGNYWNDPHHQDLYRKTSQFLAVLNNDTYNPHSQEYKANFLRLRKMVMIGGPDDGVITPWQSSHFAFYDDQESVVEMEKQQWYTADTFGLRTLDERGDLVTHEMPGVPHTHWHANYTVFRNLILPYLT